MEMLKTDNNAILRNVKTQTVNKSSSQPETSPLGLQKIHVKNIQNWLQNLFFYFMFLNSYFEYFNIWFFLQTNWLDNF